MATATKSQTEDITKSEVNATVKILNENQDKNL